MSVARPRRHDHHRHVRRRALGGGRRARGPRLLRDRQPAARAHREGRRARRGAATARSGSRSSSTCARASSSTTSTPRSPSCARAARSTRVLFLDAADDVLVRRYEESRRKHPLAADERVLDGIADERALLEELKGDADVVVDTSDLNVHELRDRLRELFADDAARRRAADEHRVVRVQARPARRRRPRVRLPLPARTRTGSTSCARSPAPTRGARLRARRSRRPRPFLDELERLFALLLPAYVREGKSYLSIGDRLHRRPAPQRRRSPPSSPACSSGSASPPRVHHRDLDRG